MVLIKWNRSYFIAIVKWSLYESWSFETQINHPQLIYCTHWMLSLNALKAWINANWRFNRQALQIRQRLIRREFCLFVCCYFFFFVFSHRRKTHNRPTCFNNTVFHLFFWLFILFQVELCLHSHLFGRLHSSILLLLKLFCRKLSARLNLFYERKNELKKQFQVELKFTKVTTLTTEMMDW